MVVPEWCLPVGLSLLGIFVSFWGWLAVKVIEQGRKLVELEAELKSQKDTCKERLEWMRELDQKVDEVPEKVVELLVNTETLFASRPKKEGE